MSVITVKVKKDVIEMASDSIAVVGWTNINHKNNKTTKMCKYNDMIIGGVGYCEEISLLFHYMKTHTIEIVDEKGVLDFIIKFQRWQKDFTGNHNGLENTYILAFKGKCFGVSNMFVYEINDYYAIGAGMHYALGALHEGAEAKEAVKAACDLCASVAEPIVVESIPR